MGFALVLRELASQRRKLAVGAVIALIAAVMSVYRLDGLTLKPRALKHSSASTTVLVDTPSSSLGDLSALASVSGSYNPLTVRATVLANFMATPAILDLIGHQMGISGGQIYAAGPVDLLQPIIVQEPTDLKRNIQITGETDPYRLNFAAEANLPTIGINAQAPTTPQAVKLANAAAVAIQQYVAGLQTQVPQKSRVTVRVLGKAVNGSVDNAHISISLATIVFLAVFSLWCVLMLVARRFRTNWRAAADVYRARQADYEWPEYEPATPTKHLNGHRDASPANIEEAISTSQSTR